MTVDQQHHQHDFSVDVACGFCDRWLSEVMIEKHRHLQEATDLLADLVSAYRAMPDGPLGRGLTTGHFLRASDWLNERKREKS